VALQKEYKKIANKIQIHLRKNFVFYLQIKQKKNVQKKRLGSLFDSSLNAFLIVLFTLSFSIIS